MIMSTQVKTSRKKATPARNRKKESGTAKSKTNVGKKADETNEVITIENIKLSLIKPSSFNPRKSFPDEELEELALNIKQNGLIQPITVRKKGKGFEIVCGERRYRAIVKLDWETVPAIVKDINDKDAFELALTENILRENLSVIDEVNAIKQLVDMNKTSISEIAVRSGKSEKYIRQRLALFELVDEIKDLLARDKIGVGIALEIAKYDSNVQTDVFDRFLNGSSYPSWLPLSVDEFKKRMESEYTMSLEKYCFDKTDCQFCPRNTLNTELRFDEEQQGKCTDFECLSLKNKQFIIQECELLTSNEPDIAFYKPQYGETDEDILELMEDKGVSIVSGWAKTFPAEPDIPDGKEYDNIDDFNEAMEGYQNDLEKYQNDSAKVQKLLDEKKAVKVVYLNKDTPEIRYVELKEEELLPEDPIEKLNKQDERNLQIAKENILKDATQHIKQNPIPHSALSEMEDKLIYIAMLDCVKPSNFIHFGFEEAHKYSLSLDERYDIYMNLTEDQKIVIVRDFLVAKLSGYQPSKFSALFLEFIRLHFPDVIDEIEKKYFDIYQKRHDKIQERLKPLLENTSDEELDDLPEDFDMAEEGSRKVA